MVTQTEAILAALRDRGEAGLTSLEALEEFGSFRLAARIADAKLRLGPGEYIASERLVLPSGKVVARYVLRQRERAQQAALWP